MDAFVALELFQGVVNSIKVFCTKESEDNTKRKYLKGNNIRVENMRECKEQDGTEFILRECEVHP